MIAASPTVGRAAEAPENCTESVHRRRPVDAGPSTGELLVEGDVSGAPAQVALQVSAAVNNTKLYLAEVRGQTSRIYPVVDGVVQSPGRYWFRFHRRHAGMEIDSLDLTEIIDRLALHVSVRSVGRLS